MVDDAQRLGRVGRGAAEHGDIADPERHAGDERDLGDIDDGWIPGRVHSKPHKTACQRRGAQRMPDRITGETRKRDDGKRHSALVDRMQRQKVVGDQI